MEFGYTKFMPIFHKRSIVMTDYVTKRHKIFLAELKEDEKILWMGESQNEWWRLSLKRLALSLLGIIGIVIISVLSIYFLHKFVLYVSAFYTFVTMIYAFFIMFLGIEILPRVYRFALRKEYFAISNQRVLIYSFGKVTAYSLILMADAIKHKPKQGKTTISLYDKTSYTGRMPAPIARLKNLTDKEAEKAYELLKKAREDSFLERIVELEQAQNASLRN